MTSTTAVTHNDSNFTCLSRRFLTVAVEMTMWCGHSHIPIALTQSRFVLTAFKTASPSLIWTSGSASSGRGFMLAVGMFIAARRLFSDLVRMLMSIWMAPAALSLLPAIQIQTPSNAWAANRVNATQYNTCWPCTHTMLLSAQQLSTQGFCRTSKLHLAVPYISPSSSLPSITSYCFS